jgi:hypothetical protein
MKPFSAAVGAVCLLAVVVNAQQQQQQQTLNAAVRYWMAFAVLQDPPANASTTALVVRVAEGIAPWDEAQLGPILDANSQSLEIMERASTLRSCDWGIEYELGPHAPIAHLARARVLGRLSVLSGMRLAAGGQTSEAVDRWLTAIRFSQHVAHGGTLISLLSANAALLPSLRGLAGEVSRLTPESRARIEAELRALPETGFDWPDAMQREERALVAGVRMNAIPNLRTQDLGALRTTVGQIVEALRLPPDRARTALASVNLGSLPFPSPIRVNEQREVIRAARQKVLDLVAR